MRKVLYYGKPIVVISFFIGKFLVYLLGFSIFAVVIWSTVLILVFLRLHCYGLPGLINHLLDRLSKKLGYISITQQIVLGHHKPVLG